jgi:outer membrane protein assembly factor BamB
MLLRLTVRIYKSMSLLLVTMWCCVVMVSADDWPQFRGPQGLGISTEGNLPEKWDDRTNIEWKTALPGPGHSSPVIWGNRIFLTAFQTQGPRRLVVLCLDKKTGDILWTRDIGARRFEAVHQTNSPASSTPVTDGRQVYTYFNSLGLICFDFAGRKIWEKRLGPFPIEWGSGSSPILYKDLLLLNCDTDGEDFLLAVEKKTGKTVWKTARPPAQRAWPSPLIWNDQIIISGSGGVRAYDPKDGHELWVVEGTPKWVAPTPVAAHGLLYVTANGLDPENFVLAVRPGGSGNITASHIAWRYSKSVNSIPSPVVAGEYLYLVKNGGIMTCLKARTGELVWQERLPGRGDYYASPIAADGKIYALSEEGIMTVIRAKPSYDLISVNPLTERCLASPAISDGQIFIRSDNHLFCIARKSR